MRKKVPRLNFSIFLDSTNLLIEVFLKAFRGNELCAEISMKLFLKKIFLELFRKLTELFPKSFNLKNWKKKHKIEMQQVNRKLVSIGPDNVKFYL